MAWSTPRTWVASEVVTASVMNTHVKDQLDYLHTARQKSIGMSSDYTLTTSSAAISTASPTTVTLDTDGKWLVLLLLEGQFDTVGGDDGTVIEGSVHDGTSTICRSSQQLNVNTPSGHIERKAIVAGTIYEASSSPVLTPRAYKSTGTGSSTIRAVSSTKILVATWLGS